MLRLIVQVLDHLQRFTNFSTETPGEYEKGTPSFTPLEPPTGAIRLSIRSYGGQSAERCSLWPAQVEYLSRYERDETGSVVCA